MKPVVQEHPMGCAVACVASLCGISYKSALRRFKKPEHAWGRGYYCREICAALGKENFMYAYFPKSVFAKRGVRIPVGTIVFIARSKKHVYGHFLLKTPRGWMNSWVNEPVMTPVKAAFERRLPGRAQWIIYEK